MYKKGDIVVAKNSHKECGYRRGDTLQIDRESCFPGEFVAINLTRGGETYLGEFFRGKKMNNEDSDTYLYEITVFGLPLFKVRKVPK